jgi:acyl-CoA reductase-like NAD-dependent aldehyde dehydrogenase
MEFQPVQPFISELLRAANEVARLTNPERARLLRRAAVTIRDYRDEINFSGRLDQVLKRAASSEPRVASPAL